MFALSRLIKQSDDTASSSAPSSSSSRSHTSPQYKELTLLFARLSSSTLHEDKRQSITALHELTATYSDLPLSPSQLEQLLGLADDMQRDDPDISRLALQSVHQLLAPPQPGQGGSVDRSSQLELVSMFASNPPYIHLLLSFLSSSHFHLRFTGMQLLTQLLMEKAARDRLQQSIIASGGSVMQLVELLDDTNEVIRGEALLLLEALIHRSPDIQKMVAFNGGFDSLLMAVKREGGLLEAGVIGEDAMRLVCGLLQDNRSNQQLFAEMGCAKLTAMLLQSAEQRLNAESGKGGAGLKDEARNSLCFVLDAVSYVSSSAASLPSLAPLVAPLLDLSLSAHLPASMCLTCLSLVAMLVDGCKQGQQALSSHHLPSFTNAGQPLRSASPILFLLSRAAEVSGRLLSSLSLHTLRCFFHDNKDAQLQAVMSFSPSSTQSPVAVGSLLLQPFASRTSFPHSSSSPSRSPRATSLIVVSELVRRNLESQQLLLKLPLQHTPSGHSAANVTWQDTLLDHMRKLFTSAPSSTSADSVPVEEVAALCFVCDWVNGCVEVAESLFTRQSFLQQLLTLATTHASRYVRGLATYAFLLCLQLQQSGSGGGAYTFLTAASLLSLIQHSISLDLFKRNLTALHTSPAFTILRSATQRDVNPFHRYTARRMRKAGGEGQEHVFVVEDGGVEDEDEGETGRAYVISRDFVFVFDKAYESMNDRLLSLLTAALSSSTGQASIVPASSSPSAPSAELLRLREENGALRRENDALRAQLSQRPQHPHTAQSASETNQLQTIVTQQRQEIAQLKEDLLILQHAEEDRSRANTFSSSSALATLQRKYDDLQAEHEDLLLLLAQYAERDEAEQGDGATMQNGDSSHATSDSSSKLVAAEQPVAATTASSPTLSYPQNGYHSVAASSTTSPPSAAPATPAPPINASYTATTSTTKTHSIMPQPGSVPAPAARLAVTSAPRFPHPVQSTSHASGASTQASNPYSLPSAAKPPPSATTVPAAPSMDYYSQLYASRLSSPEPSASSSSSSPPSAAFKPPFAFARPAFTPPAPPSLSTTGNGVPSRSSSNVR